MLMKSALSNNIGKLFQDTEFHDFQIVCQGKVIPVHRNILACSSSVFHSMLTNDTLENQTGQLTIKDMKPDIVDEMVNYIYTGTVKDLYNKAMDLFVAADRFEEMSTFVVLNTKNKK